MTSQRPDSCQTSAGFSAGSSISCAPIASISSRTIRWILSSDSLREKQVAVNAGGKLADVTGAQQQLVADNLGFGGVLAQCGNEQLAPEQVVKGHPILAC